MRFLIFILFSLISVGANFLFAQKDYGKLYNTDKFTSIYLPLGKISFADSVIDFRMGKPPPLKKYSDTYQCLHEPNYTTYSSPTYLSLGCKGSLTVTFNDNGFMNLPGYDLYIFEVGPSKESAKIEISNNGIAYAIRNATYKLIKFNNGSEEFYNLITDAYENNNLIGSTLTTEASNAKAALEAAQVA